MAWLSPPSPPLFKPCLFGHVDHTWNSSLVVDKANKDAEAQETGHKTQNDHWNVITIVILLSAVYNYKQNNTSVKRKGWDTRERNASIDYSLRTPVINSRIVRQSVFSYILLVFLSIFTSHNLCVNIEGPHHLLITLRRMESLSEPIEEFAWQVYHPESRIVTVSISRSNILCDDDPVSTSLRGKCFLRTILLSFSLLHSAVMGPVICEILQMNDAFWPTSNSVSWLREIYTSKSL